MADILIFAPPPHTLSLSLTLSAHKTRAAAAFFISTRCRAAADARKINEGKIIVKDYNGEERAFLITSVWCAHTANILV
jgi:hypothetical protein